MGAASIPLFVVITAMGVLLCLCWPSWPR